MMIRFSSRGLPAGELLVWLHRSNGSSRALGVCHRTRWGKWQLRIDNAYGRQFRKDFAKLTAAQKAARAVWRLPDRPRRALKGKRHEFDAAATAQEAQQ